MNTDVMFSSANEVWATPQDFSDLPEFVRLPHLSYPFHHVIQAEPFRSRRYDYIAPFPVDGYPLVFWNLNRNFSGILHVRVSAVNKKYNNS